jgi:hypothetical protein
MVIELLALLYVIVAVLLLDSVAVTDCAVETVESNGMYTRAFFCNENVLPGFCTAALTVLALPVSAEVLLLTLTLSPEVNRLWTIASGVKLLVVLMVEMFGEIVLPGSAVFANDDSIAPGVVTAVVYFRVLTPLETVYVWKVYSVAGNRFENVQILSGEAAVEPPVSTVDAPTA